MRQLALFPLAECRSKRTLKADNCYLEVAMATLYRKGETEAREVEMFQLDLEEGDLETMRADPERFVRDALKDHLSLVNGVSIDARVMASLTGSETLSGVIVHHTVSGKWESWVEVTRM
ncbi:hypothetical protein ACFVHB_34875 [Kitasatospora sp. NPDC127111]|uniref:hypothetical protein n=1 Tax=Kitasatospora sp. NPDC127111 TaxID=3345363 RepID=UPI0036334057